MDQTEAKFAVFKDLVNFMYWTIVMFDIDYFYTKDVFRTFASEGDETLLDMSIKYENWHNRDTWLRMFDKVLGEFYKNPDLLKNMPDDMREDIQSIIIRNELYKLSYPSASL